MLVAVGWWPEDVDFDFSDLATVGVILEARQKARPR